MGGRGGVLTAALWTSYVICLDVIQDYSRCFYNPDRNSTFGAFSAVLVNIIGKIIIVTN